jgi:hypothetical protein
LSPGERKGSIRQRYIVEFAAKRAAFEERLGGLIERRFPMISRRKT